MDCIYILEITIFALAALCGYYISIPTPPDVAEPWSYKLLVALNTFLYLVGYLYSRFTGDDPVFIHAKLQNAFMVRAKPPVAEELMETHDVINGVKVRILQKRHSNDAKRPAVIFFHGGGFYTGSVYMYDGLIQRFIRDTGCIAFLVDYRLSLEKPAPGPIDECQKATEGIFDDAKKWRLDRKKVILVGDSAGGNLAAAVSLRLRDAESLHKPAAQILLYPWLQALDFHLPAFQQNNQYFVKRIELAFSTVLFANVSRELIANIDTNTHVSSKTFQKYKDLISPSFLPQDMIDRGYISLPSKLPDIALSKELEDCVTNPYYFPLMHDDLSDLPPAFILTEEYDVLRDDGVIYAKRLESAGVPVTLFNDREGFHAMFCFMISKNHAYVIADKVVEFIKTVI